MTVFAEPLMRSARAREQLLELLFPPETTVWPATPDPSLGLNGFQRGQKESGSILPCANAIVLVLIVPWLLYLTEATALKASRPICSSPKFRLL